MFFFAYDFLSRLGPSPTAGLSTQFTPVSKPSTGDKAKGKEVEGTFSSGTLHPYKSTSVPKPCTEDKSKGKAAVEGAPLADISSPMSLLQPPEH